MEPIREFLGTVIEFAWDTFVVWPWEHITVPILEFVFKTTPEALWTAFIKVLDLFLRAFLYILELLIDVFQWFWSEVTVPVGKFVFEVLSWLWSNIIWPTLDFLLTTIFIKIPTWGLEAVKWTWINIVVPVGEVLTTVVEFAWDTLVVWPWEHITVPTLEFVFRTVPEALIRALLYILEKVWDAFLWIL